VTNRPPPWLLALKERASQKRSDPSIRSAPLPAHRKAKEAADCERENFKSTDREMCVHFKSRHVKRGSPKSAEAAIYLVTRSPSRTRKRTDSQNDDKWPPRDNGNSSAANRLLHELQVEGKWTKIFRVFFF
jgi:hypothetical protein